MPNEAPDPVRTRRNGKSPDRLRGAVIGCGYVSEFHLRGWARIPEVEICALADPERARAEARRAEFAPAARIYDGLAAVLAHEKLDFVDLITPPGLHREQCQRAADAGLHVICQKPLCDRLTDAEFLVARLRQQPRHFVVHENHRFRPWFQEVLRLHRAGFFGRIRHLRLEQHDPVEPPQKINLEAERGVWLQYGVHLADMVHALLGDPVRVYARLAHINPRVRGESLAQVSLEYPEVTAGIDVSWKAAGVRQGGALLIGEEGEAFYEGCLTRGDSARFRLCQGNTVVRDEVRSPTADYLDSFYQLERDFTDAVLQDRPPPQPAVENIRSLRIGFAAYAAAESGRAVEMADIGLSRKAAP